MCGILLLLKRVAESAELRCGDLADGGDGSAVPPDPEGSWGDRMLSRRGPDSCRCAAAGVGGFAAALHGSVLSMRGQTTCVQPYGDADSGILLWNGEAYSGADIDEREGDTAAVHRLLAAASDSGTPAIAAALQRLEGPYAFVFARGGRIWFGRDPLGRRSLVWTPHERGLLVASAGPPISAPASAQLAEVPTAGVYCIESVDGSLSCAVTCHRWPRMARVDFTAMAGREGPPSGDELNEGQERYLAALEQAVRRRCELAAPHPPTGPEQTGARIGLLFSGGLDSMVLAALAHRAVPASEPIDLCTVAFGDFTSATPDRIAARQGLAELRAACPGRKWNLIEIDFDDRDVVEACSEVASLIAPCNTVMDVNIGCALWFAAAGCGRLSTAPPPPAPSSLIRRAGAAEEPAAAAEGSEGGFDALTAALENEYALERHDRMLLGDVAKAHSLPWRRLGYRRCAEYARAAADAGVITLVGTGTDMRVSLPGWEPPVAAAGEDQQRVTSNARALLIGMGADETLAGYARHRTVYRRGGVAALAAEMQVDFDRLWKRNLGRDDRVISDRSREARTPFLDEQVLAALAALPLHQVCNLDQPPGIGDKMLLRVCAQRLSLPHAATLQKRAIQFGTRIANARGDGTVQIPRTLQGLHCAVRGCMNPKAVRKRPAEGPP
eukprot:TRINITY_DN29831_c0_g1_i1.p1 TRINITY_DN29831_c0_g1~~TRINITY_DN29831_c0_g1_i1.p1  ORF type:complete len:687 (+),score=197.20 TRINITY_DN29831_c0_g1_i1:56-2062(+)